MLDGVVQTGTLSQGRSSMGKHHDKIVKALEQRIAGVPTGKSGFKKPGSMNKKKTGYPRRSGR